MKKISIILPILIYGAMTSILVFAEEKKQDGMREELTQAVPTDYLVRKNAHDVYEAVGKAGAHKLFHKNEIQWMDSGLKVPDLNVVFDIAERRTTDNETVDEAIRYFEKQKTPFIYVRNPTNPPSEISADLALKNVNLVGRVTLMAFDLTKDLPDLPPSPTVEIRRVTDFNALNDFSIISDESFEFPQGSTLEYFRGVKNLFLADSPIQLYVGYLDGQPAGSTLLFLQSGKIAGNYWWGAKTKLRKQGVATQMVVKILNIAKEAGYSLAVAQCYDTSVRLAKRLGFKEEGFMDVYSYHP